MSSGCSRRIAFQYAADPARSLSIQAAKAAMWRSSREVLPRISAGVFRSSEYLPGFGHRSRFGGMHQEITIQA